MRFFIDKEIQFIEQKIYLDLVLKNLFDCFLILYLIYLSLLYFFILKK